MNKLILATHNEHKAEEFKQILPQFSVQTLQTSTIIRRLLKQHQTWKEIRFKG